MIKDNILATKDMEGICDGSSSAGYVELATGADGNKHIISSGKYLKRVSILSPVSQLLTITFCAAAFGDRLETGIVKIGLNDVRVLCKGLSCPII